MRCAGIRWLSWTSNQRANRMLSNGTKLSLYPPRAGKSRMKGYATAGLQMDATFRRKAGAAIACSFCGAVRSPHPHSAATEARPTILYMRIISSLPRCGCGLTSWRSAANAPDRYQIAATIVGAFVSCNGGLGYAAQSDCTANLKAPRAQCVNEVVDRRRLYAKVHVRGARTQTRPRGLIA